MTTELTDFSAKSRSEASNPDAAHDGARGEFIGSGVRELEERLRRGELRRLQLDPPGILTAIVSGHCTAVRVHNALAAGRLRSSEARWRLSPRDTIELGARGGRASLRLDRWSYLYRDPESQRLIARDRSGESCVEFDLDRWCGEAAIADRTDLDHRVQRPAEGDESEFSDVELHGTPYDREAFEAAWRRCDSFAETRRLERAARTNREDLLLRLPPGFARATHPGRVGEIFASLARLDAPVVFDLVGPGHRTTLRPSELETRANGAVLLGVGPRAQLAADQRRIGSAHLVELTGDGRRQKALELVDSRGRLVGRLRRSDDADPSTIFAWRASLKGGDRG